MFNFQSVCLSISICHLHQPCYSPASAQSGQKSSLSAWRKLRSLATYWAPSKDSDQTGLMPRLTRVFTGCTCHFVGFVMRWLIYGIDLNLCHGRYDIDFHRSIFGLCKQTVEISVWAFIRMITFFWDMGERLLEAIVFGNGIKCLKSAVSDRYSRHSVTGKGKY